MEIIDAATKLRIRSILKYFNLEKLFIAAVIFFMIPTISAAAISVLFLLVIKSIWITIMGGIVIGILAVVLLVLLRAFIPQSKCYLSDIIYTVLLSMGIDIPDQCYRDTAAVLSWLSVIDQKITMVVHLLRQK